MNVYTPTNVIVHEVDVHFESRIISKPIHVVQYDDRLPVVKVNLYTGNNGDEEYELPEGADVNIRYCRPDGHVVYNPVLGKDSTSNNVVYFEITQAMLIKNGKGRGVLEVTLNGKLACSSEIIFEIDRNPIQEDSIEATDEFKSVVQYAAEAESAASSIRDLTVEATTGEPGTEATVEKSGGTGPDDPYHLQFTIPRGETGSAGNISVVAEEYSASKTYSEGQYVIHNNDLYVAKVDISTAEAWNANHWTKLNIGDALYDQKVKMDHKADIDGSYEDLTAGSAEQLLSSVSVKDTTPYSFRPSGGNLEIGNREEQRKIVGVSAVVNQLAYALDSANWRAEANVEVTFSDGTASFVSNTATNGIRGNLNKIVEPNHIYLVACKAKASEVGEIGFLVGSTGSSSGYKSVTTTLSPVATIIKANSNAGGQSMYIYARESTVGKTIQVKDVTLVDITLWLGSTSLAYYVYSLGQTSALAWLYNYYPILNGSNIPSNTGTIQSVNVSKHRMREYNLWDEEWEVGAISVDTGLNIENPNTIRSTNYIKVIPDTTYYFQTPNNLAIRYYDINKNFIGVFDKNNAGNVSPVNNIRVTPSNCYFIRFQGLTGYGNTYNNDICISFYYDGERAGEYEPSKLHEYDYDSSVELRGMLRVDENGNIYAYGDEYNADGSAKRKFVEITLNGTESQWYKRTLGNAYFSYKVGDLGTVVNASIISDKLVFASISQSNTDIGITIANSTSYNGAFINIRIPNYDTMTLEEFKTWLSSNNITVIYELATPTEETANPYTETQVVDNWGTEEFVDAQGRSIVLPVGQVTDYLQDLKAKLETAPNAPSENGDYLVRQSSNGTEYVPYTDGTRIDNLEETKADKNGYYEEMTVGNAEQLLSNNYLEDNTAYNFRKTAGGKAVGNREIDEIIGGTLVVNQLIVNGDFASNDGWLPIGGTLSVADNVATFTKTAENPSYFGKHVTIIPNHVYLLIGTIKSAHTYIALLNSNTNVNYVKTETIVSDSDFKTVAALYKTSEAISASIFSIRNASAGGADRQVQAKKAMLIDVTQMFSSSTIADYVYNLEQTTAGAGIAWLYEYFPFLNGGYIPYNTGTLQSIVLSKHKMTGFNQWNEEWEVGGLNTTTGELWNTTDRIRSKNFIKIKPGASYYIKYPTSGVSMNYCFYDANKKIISQNSFVNTAITVPTNAFYMKFATYAQYGNVYKNDICINFSGDRNGEYEPYNGHEYTLDSSKELRGIPQIDSNGKLYFVGDRYKDSVTRYFDLVDLSTISGWAKSDNIFYVRINGADLTGEAVTYALCNKYVYASPQVEKSFVFVNKNLLRIQDSSYADVESFVSSLSGVILLYKNEATTTEEATPVPNPQICSPYGTEEYIDPRVEEGTIPFAIPTGHDTEYLQNLRQKLDDLPFAPTENGDYLVRVSSDGIAFIPFANGTQIPTIPTTTDGRYDLVADVANGTVTLSWVARS